MASISDRVGDLGGYLREQREHARLSVRQLATLTGVSNPYLSQVERGLRNPSAEVLQQIARGLRISAEALYVRAGILEEQQRPGVDEAVQADPALTDRQKRVLLDIHAAFCAENARAARDAAERDDLPGSGAVGELDPASSAAAAPRRAARRRASPRSETGTSVEVAVEAAVEATREPARRSGKRATGERATAEPATTEPATGKRATAERVVKPTGKRATGKRTNGHTVAPDPVTSTADAALDAR